MKAVLRTPDSRRSPRLRATALVTLLAFSASTLSPAIAWAEPLARPAPDDALSTADVRASSVDAERVVSAADAQIGSADAIQRARDASTGALQEPNLGALPGGLQASPSESPSEPLALPTGADKSGATSQAISAPQGSGKIDGMGESFSTQLSTGAATFNVPIAIPAARGRAQPSLALAYSSSGGQGVAGMGWELGVPFIARQTDRGLPSYADGAGFSPNQDRFVFNGGQELVPICTVTAGLECRCEPQASGGCLGGGIDGERMPPWSAGAMYFRARVEGSFQRFFWSPDRKTWRVQDKSGVTLELGVPLDGSGDLAGLERNPDDLRQIYKWHLVRQYDTYGAANPASATALPDPVNVVVYRYVQDGGAAYLSDIFHTTPASTPTSRDVSTYAHHVRLAYEPRTDPTFSYRSGFRIDRRLRLRRVDVASKPFNGGVGEARRMVRRYHLSYEAGRYASLLSAVQVEGRCAAATSDANAVVSEQNSRAENGGALPETTSCPRLPAMTFGYSHVAPFKADGSPSTPGLAGHEGFDERVRAIASSPPHSVDEALSDLFDIDSDGLPDVLVTAPGTYGNAHAVFLNSVGGNADTFGAADPVGVQGVLGADAGTIKLSNLNVAPLDLDGDGSIDLLHMPAVKKYAVYRPERAGNRWSWVGREVTTASGQNPQIDFGRDTLDTKLVDVNFDGLVDVVVSSGTEFRTFFSLGRYAGGDGQFGSASWASPTQAQISNDPVRRCVPWSGAPARLSDAEIQFADMNGDGIQDLVRVRRGDIQYWPGRGDGTWGTGRLGDCPAGTFSDNRYLKMSSSPQFSDIEGTSLRIDDVNGDGLDDLVQVRFNAVDIWLNQGGTSWTDRHIIRGTPESPSYANRVRLADVNGSGTRDILWGDARRYRYMDLQGGAQPGLLTRVENGLGKSTDIEYTTSTAEMLAAEKKGGACNPDRKPWESPWCSKMPTVAHVVKRVTESDNLVVAGKPPCVYVTEYSYRDPVFEGRQREFRGFRKVRARRIGDDNSPTDVTESTFLLGECKDETPANGVDECAVKERWRDNPREALKGLPILTERYDERGVYLSSEALTYRLRRLYLGLDGREVRHAFERGKRTYLYDTALGSAVASPEPAPFSSVELERECSEFDPVLGDPLALPAGVATGDETAAVFVRRPAGRAEIVSSSVVDCFGNPVVAVAQGCVEGAACPGKAPGDVGPSAIAIGLDETILSYTLPEQIEDGHTGWLWRTVESYVLGRGHPGVLRNRNFTTYDEFGAPVMVEAELGGTIALERFHAVSGRATAPPPPERSADGTILLSTTSYDALGNPIRQTGANGRCSDLGYDETYAALTTSETVFSGGCDVGPLTTGAAYDRGLAKATSVIDLQLQPTRVELDGFGRLSTLARPHPTVAGGLSPLPSVRVEYFLPPSLGAAHSVIHTSTQDGAALGSDEYLESFGYVDGLGRAIVTLSEADPQAGDAGAWIASELSEYDNKNAVRRKYLAFFYAGDPKGFPVGAARGGPYGRQRYDAFGRQLQTFDLDGTVTLESRYHALSTDLFDAADLEPGPHQGTPASERKDGHGRTIVTTERIHVSGLVEQRDIRTEFMPTGEPEVITRVRVDQADPPVMRWLRYDSLGRMVLNVEPHTAANFTSDKAAPDSGLRAWRYAYSDAGDLVGTTDARGCGVNFGYDGAGRLVTEDFSPCEAHHPDYSAPDLAAPGGPTGVEALYFFDSAPAAPFAGLTRPPELAVVSQDFFRGCLVAVWDRASANWTSYDGRGRVVQSARQILKPVATLRDQPPGVAARYAPRWYYRDTAFDAADREIAASTGAEVAALSGVSIAPASAGLPADALFTASSARRTSAVTTAYTRRGTVHAAGGSHGELVSDIVRTADGLLSRIEYGDAAHTSTSFSYDDRRRIAGVQTYRGAPGAWSNASSSSPAPDPSGPPSSFQLLLQDEDFRYDAVNNPVEIRDWRNDSEWPAGAKPVTRKVQYDDLYRAKRVDLQYSGGEDAWTSPFAPELDGSSDPRRAEPSPHVAFDRRMTWQTFDYDWLGNSSRTDDDAHGFYDRSLGLIMNDVAGGRPYQLKSAASQSGISSGRDGSVAAAYDAAGNLTRLNLARSLSPASLCLPASGQCSQRFAYDWDEVGRLARARRWDAATSASPGDALPAAVPAADLTYHYDASDARTLKTARDGTNAAHTAYIFDSLELRRAAFDAGEYVRSDQTEVPYLFANDVRLGRLVFEAPLDGEPRVGGAALHVFFELGDHLGSTSVVLDKATGELVERSTYQAYGAAESDYRPERWKGFREDYRFTGKEEDVEVGLQYFGKRFYAPALGRWVSVDPLAVHVPHSADLNVYAYIKGSVLTAIDPMGLAEQATQPIIEPLDEYGATRDETGKRNYKLTDPFLITGGGPIIEPLDEYGATRDETGKRNYKLTDPLLITADVPTSAEGVSTVGDVLDYLNPLVDAASESRQAASAARARFVGSLRNPITDVPPFAAEVPRWQLRFFGGLGKAVSGGAVLADSIETGIHLSNGNRYQATSSGIDLSLGGTALAVGGTAAGVLGLVVLQKKLYMAYPFDENPQAAAVERAHILAPWGIGVPYTADSVPTGRTKSLNQMLEELDRENK